MSKPIYWDFTFQTMELDDLSDALRGFVLSTVQKNRSNTQ